MRYFRILGCLFLLAHEPAFADASTQTREYPIMAAYIYNFTQFTTWPQAAMDDGVTICVVGRNPFGELLTSLTNKTVQNAPIALQYHATANNISTCDVLFVASGNVRSALAATKDKSILTMSNTEGFANAGGMVEFTKVDTKITITINNGAVKQSGLTISSKLLSLAHVVE